MKNFIIWGLIGLKIGAVIYFVFNTILKKKKDNQDLSKQEIIRDLFDQAYPIVVFFLASIILDIIK